MMPPTELNPNQPTPSGALARGPDGPGRPESRALAAPADGEEGGQSSTSGAAVLRALQRRWLLALTLAVVLTPAAAAAAWFLVPARHMARNILLVHASTPAILYSKGDNPITFVNYQRTQMALVKSRLVLYAALKKPGIASLRTLRAQADPVDWMEREIKTDYKLAPELMTISLTGDRPDDLMAIVNAVREAYIKEIVEKERNDRAEHLKRLQDLFADYEDILKEKQKTLQTLGRKVGAVNPENLTIKHKYAMERLAFAQKELLQLQSKLRQAIAEAELEKARGEDASKIEVPEATVNDLLKKDPVVQKRAEEVSKAKELIEQTIKLSRRGKREPAVANFRARLEAARAALEARKAALRPDLVRQLREKAQHDILAGAEQTRKRVKLLNTLKESVKGEVKKLTDETDGINSGSLEIEQLQGDMGETEKVAKAMATQIEMLKVEQSAPARVRLMEDASTTSEDNKRRLMATGGSGALALCLAVFGVVWLEVRARRINSPDDVKVGARIRLVGTLPALAARRRPALLAGQRGPAPPPGPAQRLLLESVDATRTVLVHTARSEGLRAVMVTSAVSGEGKTSLSSQLAASLARGGFNTLLIDGDLRRPGLHRLFGLARGPGLSELLAGRATVEQVIQPTPIAGLALITAGQCDASVFKALAQGPAKEVFRDLKARFDMVVLDSPPVLPVADSLMLGQHIDGVVFSVLRDVSRLPFLLAAYERISLLGIRMLGAVVSGVHTEFYNSASQYWAYQGSQVEAEAEAEAPGA
jgi:capsular exopolysaccharide synthesis family protein